MSRLPETASPVPSPLADREILSLFVPLALTSTMMATSVPVINAGLARLPGAETHLAAFGLAFGLSVLLESPVFALAHAMVAWYGGQGPTRPYVSFAAGMGMLVLLVEAAVVFSPLGRFLLGTLSGASPDLLDPALLALRMGIVFPPLVALRIGYQSVLVSRRRGAPIAWGTFVRLVVLAALVLLAVPRSPLSAPASAMIALGLAVVVETIFVAVAASRTRETGGVMSPAEAEGRSLSGRIRFLVPLSGMMLVNSLTNPVINAFLARTREPATAIAVYSVIASLVWFVASSVLRYSSVTIALGRDPDGLRKLRSFLWRFVGAVCAAVLVLNATPAMAILLRQGIGLDPELAERARLPIFFLSLQPLVVGFIAYYQGVLTRAARTLVVAASSLCRVLVVVGLGFLGLGLPVHGELVGGLLLGIGFLVELSCLVAFERRGRRIPVRP